MCSCCGLNYFVSKLLQVEMHCGCNTMLTHVYLFYLFDFTTTKCLNAFFGKSNVSWLLCLIWSSVRQTVVHYFVWNLSHTYTCRHDLCRAWPWNKEWWYEVCGRFAVLGSPVPLPVYCQLVLMMIYNVRHACTPRLVVCGGWGPDYFVALPTIALLTNSWSSSWLQAIWHVESTFSASVCLHNHLCVHM